MHQFINSRNIDKATPKCQPLGEVDKSDFSLKGTQTSKTEKHVIKCISNNSYLIFSSYCVHVFSFNLFNNPVLSILIPVSK